VPPGAVWPLPAYELALMTAGEARQVGHDDVQVIIVTPERGPSRPATGSDTRPNRVPSHVPSSANMTRSNLLTCSNPQ
jgi:hypothetical protein